MFTPTLQHEHRHGHGRRHGGGHKVDMDMDMDMDMNMVVDVKIDIVHICFTSVTDTGETCLAGLLRPAKQFSPVLLTQSCKSPKRLYQLHR
jgi:hypothetical protein